MIMDSILSPLIIGADTMLSTICQKKNLKDINFLFSENYFPNADLIFHFVEKKFEGSIYSVEELNLKGFVPGQSVWVCGYLSMFFDQFPKSVYVKVEQKED